jgi:amino acid transporter
MSLLGKLLGRRLASWEGEKQKLGVLTGVPVLGLDALASTGYGPEAALTILLPLGVMGLSYFPIIILAIIINLGTLYLSYRQTIAAYPNGGGAYIVAKDNLGIHAGLCAGVALLLDYLLNVAVGIAAGVGAVVSAIPALHPYTLPLCLLVLLTLTIINLRGLRESGLAFVVPVLVFLGCIAAVIFIGLIRTWLSSGHPHPVVPLPAIPRGTATVSAWLLMGAFANGCTAMTGVEAVSNGVPLFREPAVPNAQRTLTVIVAILSMFLLGVAYLCSVYHIGAMDEQQPGYQTILSQLVAAVAGQGVFYHVAIASIFIVLTYSAQTSFTDFPRVCRLLAEDGFLPHAFADLGRRLVFTQGIVVLATLSCLILIAFGGVTDRLIPLFAVGAFSAFLFSQAGMVMHWLRKTGSRIRIALVYNALGVVVTGMALVVIVVAKFIEGAWMTIIVAPPLVFLLLRIKRHYKKVAREIGAPLKLRTSNSKPPVVIVPIDGWNRVAEKAVRFGLLLSDDVTAVHVNTEDDDTQGLKELWADKVEKPAKAANSPIPRLEIIPSPYRMLHQPILDFVNKAKKEKPDRLIAVVIPQLVQPHWYQYLLHDLDAAKLRTLLFLERDQRTVVISTPWYLREETPDGKK